MSPATIHHVLSLLEVSSLHPLSRACALFAKHAKHSRRVLLRLTTSRKVFLAHQRLSSLIALAHSDITQGVHTLFLPQSCATRGKSVVRGGACARVRHLSWIESAKAAAEDEEGSRLRAQKLAAGKFWLAVAW
eukprot:SAG22_NODE_2994_length_2043_cov_1.358539_2_plen_133_part_00